ncbi:MAG: double zinc ribbon domain-containing protein [Gemmatimonadaceae bacterium]
MVRVPAGSFRDGGLGAGLAALLDLLLPPACAACGGPLGPADGGRTCGTCWARVAVLPAPRCARCGHPEVPGRRCRWCDLLPPWVRAVRSVCWVTPDAVASHVVHALKYHGWRGVAEGMAARMARLEWPADVLAERTALVPVPLAASRERERGFNQSVLLARALGARWGIPVWTAVLERTRATATQTRLTPDRRAANVRGAFRALPSAPPLRGAHVVVVDDVVTTAATLNACAEALLAGGARIVSYVTFGRAPALGDRST